MAMQSAWNNTSDQPTAPVKAATDVVRTTNMKAVAGQHELVEYALDQGKENANAWFDTLHKMTAVTSPFEIAALSTRFLIDATQRRMQQLKAIGEMMARSGKDAAQSLGEVIEPVMPMAPHSPSIAPVP